MSQKRKSQVISIDRQGRKISSSVARKRMERKRHRDSGRVAVTVHVAPEHRAAIRTVEAILNQGGRLSHRLLNFVEILAYRLPEKIRFRKKQPRISRQAARTAMAQVIRAFSEKKVA